MIADLLPMQYHGMSKCLTDAKVDKAFLIYGAGEAATLFFENSSLKIKNSIVGFIDDDETVCGGQLFGCKYSLLKKFLQ